MMNWYKAIVYLNGDKVQEMFDFSLQELKTTEAESQRAGCHKYFTAHQAVLWTSEPRAWDSAVEAVQIQAT